MARQKSKRPALNNSDSGVSRAEGDFQRRYAREVQKQPGGWGNFHLDARGDLVTNEILTHHARERRKERGITEKDALNRYAKKTAHGVIATVYKPNNQKPLWTPPSAKDLPQGHCIEVLTLPKTCVGHIIGSKGRNIARITKDFCVDARVTNKTTSGSQNIHVWGPSSNVKTAIADIKVTRDAVMAADAKRAERADRKAKGSKMPKNEEGEGNHKDNKKNKKKDRLKNATFDEY